MNGCVFCQIVKREAPALIVCETDDAMAFLPLHMEVYGHTLIAPKLHFADLYDIADSALSDVTNLSRKLAQDYRDNIGATGANLMLASGEDAEQSVFHLHFHLLPRFKGDGLKTWPNLPPFHEKREDVYRRLIS